MFEEARTLGAAANRRRLAKQHGASSRMLKAMEADTASGTPELPRMRFVQLLADGGVTPELVAQDVMAAVASHPELSTDEVWQAPEGDFSARLHIAAGLQPPLIQLDAAVADDGAQEARPGGDEATADVPVSQGAIRLCLVGVWVLTHKLCPLVLRRLRHPMA